MWCIYKTYFHYIFISHILSMEVLIDLRQNQPLELFSLDFSWEWFSRKLSIGYLCQAIPTENICMMILHKSTIANFLTTNFCHKSITNNSITIFMLEFPMKISVRLFLLKISDGMWYTQKCDWSQKIRSRKGKLGFTLTDPWYGSKDYHDWIAIAINKEKIK